MSAFAYTAQYKILDKENFGETVDIKKIGG